MQPLTSLEHLTAIFNNNLSKVKKVALLTKDAIFAVSRGFLLLQFLNDNPHPLVLNSDFTGTPKCVALACCVHMKILPFATEYSPSVVRYKAAV